MVCIICVFSLESYSVARQSHYGASSWACSPVTFSTVCPSIAANNYAADLKDLSRLEEAKSILRKTTPVARRVLGENDRLTLKMRWNYAETLYADPGATLDDLREAATTLEDAERIARRVFGGTNPITTGIERSLRKARAALRTRETPPPGGST